MAAINWEEIIKSLGGQVVLLAAAGFLIKAIVSQRLLKDGGWPRLNSEKRLWVAHPCGFCKGGVFLLSLF